MSDIREISNPHDKVTIDYTDKDAARIAVLLLGSGRYGIRGEGGMPVFILGGSAEWIKSEYGMDIDAWFDSVPAKRIVAAFRTISNTGRVTSMSDIVSFAHKYADFIERNEKAK